MAVSLNETRTREQEKRKEEGEGVVENEEFVYVMLSVLLKTTVLIFNSRGIF